MVMLMTVLLTEVLLYTAFTAPNRPELLLGLYQYTR